MSPRPPDRSWQPEAWLRERFRVIGVVHLLPLPGSARHRDPLEAIEERALEDARRLVEGGVDALIVENFGDAPFAPHRVPDETLAAFVRIAWTLRRTFPEVPLGINLLRNAARQAVAVAAAVDARFVRINVPVGVFAAPSGWLVGQAREAALLRKQLGVQGLGFFEDLMVKHAWPVGPEVPPEVWVRETEERGLADALIVTGTRTGAPVDPAILDRVLAVARRPVLVGSGVTVNTLPALVGRVQGVIVGTALKVSGKTAEPVDSQRVRRFMQRVRELESQGAMGIS